ncbi:hypothetical protein SADUNF_Sadunf17G0040600 [Salix dunnii]|uniref:Uncharacterized protein n=1 Tax=Salix dunnii TaxID=1413687 RepID=A0A835MH15_9ROSI|nr:hypothetical protein SADUNF_Sadunf17G0040600 [Salix dunnii]
MAAWTKAIVALYRKLRKAILLCTLEIKDGFFFSLRYLNNEIVREILRLADEEFGLPSSGPLMLPCDGEFMEYAIPSKMMKAFGNAKSGYASIHGGFKTFSSVGNTFTVRSKKNVEALKFDRGYQNQPAMEYICFQEIRHNNPFQIKQNSQEPH